MYAVVFNGNEDSFRAWAGLGHVPTWQETIEARVTDVERRLTNLGG